MMGPFLLLLHCLRLAVLLRIDAARGRGGRLLPPAALATDAHS